SRSGDCSSLYHCTPEARAFRISLAVGQLEGTRQAVAGQALHLDGFQGSLDLVKLLVGVAVIILGHLQEGSQAILADAQRVTQTLKSHRKAFLANRPLAFTGIWVSAQGRQQLGKRL